MPPKKRHGHTGVRNRKRTIAESVKSTGVEGKEKKDVWANYVLSIR